MESRFPYSHPGPTDCKDAAAITEHISTTSPERPRPGGPNDAGIADGVPLRRRRLVVLSLLALVLGLGASRLIETDIDPTAIPEAPLAEPDPHMVPPLSTAESPAFEDPPVAFEITPGLHYTAEEVAIWRQRAVIGPFRSASGTPDHYPGDWDRIIGNANDFRSDPQQAQWAGPPGDGCVQQSGSGESRPPQNETHALRDSAFAYLVTGDTEYRDAAKEALLWQARFPGTQFDDRDRWCVDFLYDINPSFDISIWLAQLLYAYDYLGPDSFGANEQDLLNRWFYHAADFWQHDVNHSHDTHYADRREGDYTLTLTSCQVDDIAFFGSDTLCHISLHYNNRKAHIVRFVTGAGIKLSNESFTPPEGASPGMALDDLMDTGRMFTKEWLMFSVHPDGYFGEFERWNEDSPIQGWLYTAGVLSPVIAIADELARAGDPSLLEYTTRDGAFGTTSAGGRDWGTGEEGVGEGPPKSLEFALESYAKYVDGTYVRYGTDDESKLQEDYLIRPFHEPSGYRSNVDAGVMMANLYYDNDYIKDMYLRRGDGMPSYPKEPADAGLHGWMGNGRVYPGVLFMFADLEGRVWPYSDAG